MRSEPSPSKPHPPLISISVVSHGDEGALRNMLDTLARHESADQIQLLVTDNLRDHLGDIPPTPWQSVVMLRPDRARGYAANHNAAFQRASGPYFCVVNPDVLFLEAVFPQLIRRVDKGEGQIAAPLIVDSKGVVQDSFRKLPSPWELVRRRVGLSAAVAQPASGALLHPDWIAGTFMLLRRETFADLGGFDSRFRLYFEDVDLCTRARLLGLVVLVDTGLRLGHDPRRASRRPGVQLFWHVQSAFRFFSSSAYRRSRELSSRG